MKTALIIVAGLILLSIIIISFSKKKKKDSHTQDVSDEKIVSAVTGQQVVDTLTGLGYFKYTDATKVDTLKKEIATTYD